MRKQTFIVNCGGRVCCPARSRPNCCLAGAQHARAICPHQGQARVGKRHAYGRTMRHGRWWLLSDALKNLVCVFGRHSSHRIPQQPQEKCLKLLIIHNLRPSLSIWRFPFVRIRRSEMECAISEICQNWFWPKWPCLWSRASQFTRSGRATRKLRGNSTC